MVNIYRYKGEDEKIYNLPTEILVSDDYNYFYNIYDVSLEKIVDTKSIDDEENRNVKILKVHFPNGGYVCFKNCYIPIDGDHCECNDQNEEVWSIQLKEKKVKE